MQKLAKLQTDFDIVVAGAGATGLVAAIALAQAGFATCLIGPPDVRPSARTVALLDGSLALLRNLGLWGDFATQSQALETMRLVDDTGSLFAIPSVDFIAGEIGLSEFGRNIENAVLVSGLLRAAHKTSKLTVREQMLVEVALCADAARVVTDGGETISARLVIGADGRGSRVRKAAKISMRDWDYPQVALTAILAHRRPHKNVSTEFHTRHGPCTLVPLPPLHDVAHRSSLVWMMAPNEADRRTRLDDGAFVIELEKQVHCLLGPMRVSGARSSFPMSGMVAHRLAGTRVALVGEAAHAFPPIGAQGLNLGMRDVAALVEAVVHAKTLGRDFCDAATLDSYDAARKGDVEFRTGGVDLLNRSLLADVLPMDFARGAGLNALSALPMLRRAVMRQGVHPGNLPPLMRAQPNVSR